jgi:hypothetical protein
MLQLQTNRRNGLRGGFGLVGVGRLKSRKLSEQLAEPGRQLRGQCFVELLDGLEGERRRFKQWRGRIARIGLERGEKFRAVDLARVLVYSICLIRFLYSRSATATIPA